jgi:hypothetical protein
MHTQTGKILEGCSPGFYYRTVNRSVQIESVCFGEEDTSVEEGMITDYHFTAVGPIRGIHRSISQYRNGLQSIMSFRGIIKRYF